MGYQALNGITIKPKGSYNISRFQRSFDGNQAWPTSFAFDGWIYNASCDIGFSNQPTEIKLSTSIAENILINCFKTTYRIKRVIKYFKPPSK